MLRPPPPQPTMLALSPSPLEPNRYWDSPLQNRQRALREERDPQPSWAARSAPLDRFAAVAAAAAAAASLAAAMAEGGGP
mgnify:CR=1 FL=1